MKFKKYLFGLAIISFTLLISPYCVETKNTTNVSHLSFENLEKKSVLSKRLISVGMPDEWANWSETWEELSEKYKWEHHDIDMSSSEELLVFRMEENMPFTDIGDVGIYYAVEAKKEGLLLPYKTSYWNEIPFWAKDNEGYWLASYTGTTAFISNIFRIDNPPQNWNDIKKGTYCFWLGDVMSSVEAQMSFFACTYALTGDINNIDPAIEYFECLAKEGRLITLTPNRGDFTSEKCIVAAMWDFNALRYKNEIDTHTLYVCIPKKGAVTSGYSTIINKNAPNSINAALAREYILSDDGQINLAKGYAKPIRKVKLPNSIKKLLLDEVEYDNQFFIEDYNQLKKKQKELFIKWKKRILPLL